MAKHRRRLRKITVLSLVLGLLAAGSIAYAVWTTNGSGSGYAQATTAQLLTTVDASASTSAQLYPGGTGDVELEIHNPNPYDVLVTAVAGNGVISSNAGAQCQGATTGVVFSDQSGLSISVPAGQTVPATLSGAVAMTNASDNSCQGAIFTIPVSLTGGSA
jgi:hypothetical protein